MNENNQKLKKDDSMEENINTMINDLLKEDDIDKISINDSVVSENDSTNRKVSAPIICINTVPFGENSSIRLPILHKTLSSQVNRKSNILTTNFPIQSNRNFKKMHTLEKQTSYNFKEFVPSPKILNLQANYNFPSIQVNDRNFEKNYYQSENNNPTTNSNNPMISINPSGGKCISLNYPKESGMLFRNSERIIEPELNKVYDVNEIMENKIKVNEKIDEESYHILKGNFKNLIKTHNGSRILQKSLNKTNSEILSHILYEIQDILHELMIDSYANYFCQRFYDYLAFKEKTISYHIVEISNSSIGTYPLQAVIDQIKTKEEKKIIIQAVKPYIIELCENAQGTHVIEKMIICFEEESIREIYNVILNNFIGLSCHTNGLCVIKKIISCTKNQNTIMKIIDILLENHAMLLQNQHGNYSLQMVIECWDLEYSRPIIQKLEGQFYNLSILKFSSNVVEKCLEKGDAITNLKFMEEICQKSKVMGKDNLIKYFFTCLDLIKNPYGNYVIQKALKLSSGHYRGKLISYIKKSIEKFSDKKLVNKWNNILSNFSTKNKGHPKLNLNTSDTNSNNSFTNSSNSPHSACSNHSNFSTNSNNPPTINSFKLMFVNNQQNAISQLPHPDSFKSSSFAKNKYSKSSTNSPVNNYISRINTFNTNFSNSNSNNSNSSRNNM